LAGGKERFRAPATVGVGHRQRRDDPAVADRLRGAAFHPAHGIHHRLRAAWIAVEAADEHQAQLRRGRTERRRILERQQRRVAPRDAGGADAARLARQGRDRFEIGVERGCRDGRRRHQARGGEDEWQGASHRRAV